jgi:aminobenzoyl-glutamate transport protein
MTGTWWLPRPKPPQTFQPLPPPMSTNASSSPAPRGWVYRLLDLVERIGNRLPDPAVLFLLAMILTWGVSFLLAGVDFSEIDPRTSQPLRINNLLSGTAMTTFMAKLVETFVGFHPLGVVLVAMLGLGVAEHTGFISAALRSILSVTPRMLLTPSLILVGVLSHIAVDAGYVLVVPMGGVIFYAAGRHPLAGIAAAFAGVSGGFSATFFAPSSLDPMLSGITQTAAHLRDVAVTVSPLNNFYFTNASTFVIVLLGWFITDRVIEPRLRGTAVDGDPADLAKMEPLTLAEKRGLSLATASMGLTLLVLILTLLPPGSPWRHVESGQLTKSDAPLMKAIVGLIFLFFLIPGIVYGYASGSAKSHRDIIRGMSKAMSQMGYYMVMAFFCAQFIYAFGQSNLGALAALKGANALKELGLPLAITLIGIVFLSGSVNLLIGSASAKWALIGAILVPMLMELGVSPDLSQAAYRVGDSSTNIITPLLPYFPLIVINCQRYVKSSGIGTLLALMLPYSLTFIIAWTGLLLAFWGLDIPLGLGASYKYP